MATTKKPQGGARRAPAKTARPEAGVRREVWAVVSGLLAIVSVLCLFGFDGFILQWLRQFLGAALGMGLFVLPFSLGGLCALFLVQRKGPVRLRAACILAQPVLIGALVHGLLCANRYPLAMRTFPGLIESGLGATSGGLIGGWLYILLEWALSSIGAFLILLVLTVAAVLAALRLTPAAVWGMLKTPDYAYESEEEREKYEKPAELPNLHVMAAERRGARKKKLPPEIDIPLDDAPSAAKNGRKLPPDEYLEQIRRKEKAVSGAAEGGLSVTESAPPWEKEPFSPEPDAQAAPEGDDAFGEILTLIDRGKPAAEPRAPLQWEPAKKPEPPMEEDEAAALAAAMTENQNAPTPAYNYPPLGLLTEGLPVDMGDARAELTESSQRLIDTLDSFGIEAQIMGIVRGPSVTRFELSIERGVKFSRITALSDDIALSLGAVSVRVAPIPDKMAVGIEVPNKTTATVYIREVIGSRAFQTAQSRLSFAVGKDITGAAVVGDIGRMPHMLIAGTTGSGKSVCINSMLISLLYKSTPEEVRLIMVDPKMVELGNYNGVPHLLIPVVTDPKKASGALNWAVGEMERRYQVFAENQVRNLVGYNEVMRKKREEAAQTEGGVPDNYAVLPQIVIVIDELADLMMVAAKAVETSICRIAQKARAAGMHLIVATQRPSADVITGIMKANIPSRIAFAVASQIESRIILDQTGAEKLIGKGDMLYAPLGEGKPTRVQGCFISNEEIESVIARVKEGQTAEYSEEVLEHIERQTDDSMASGGEPAEEEDEMLMDAIDIAVSGGQCSTSLLQRRLKLGYARAARIVDQMEERGIVSPSEGAKPRSVLISREEWQEMKLRREKH